MRQSSGGSIIDGISRGLMGGGTAMVERLQAQVKQKDGEIELLQVLVKDSNTARRPVVKLMEYVY